MDGNHKSLAQVLQPYAVQPQVYLYYVWCKGIELSQTGMAVIFGPICGARHIPSFKLIIIIIIIMVIFKCYFSGELISLS